MENIDLSKVADLRELDKIRIVDGRGFTRFLFGFTLNMFFLNGHDADKRLRGVEIVERYRHLLGKEITHYLPNGATRLKKMDDKAFIHYKAAALIKVKNNYGFAASVYGFPNGKESDTPTPYCAAFITSSENPLNPWYSRFDLYFPVSFVVEKGYAAFVGIVKEWCAHFRPDRGSSGFSVIFDDSKTSGGWGAYAFPFVKRFPGLDWDASTHWDALSNPYLGPKRGVADTKRTIRSINWLSIIDDDFLTELGGLDKVKTNLGPQCPVLSYKGGAILQAGPHPELGDLNDGIISAYYRTVARVLKPLRFEGYNKVELLDAPAPLNDLEETLKWIRRFD